MGPLVVAIGLIVGAVALFAAQVPRASQAAKTGWVEPMFRTSHDCLACHNGLTTPAGEDVSIGSDWRASIMANSSRDPYWQASVRREVIDHPAARHEIEDECSVCHMPMSRAIASSAGASGEIFAHLPIGQGRSEQSRLAADGVSCTLCHQIGTERLGTADSFTGGFVIAHRGARPRAMFGPFEIDAGRTAVMRSATGVEPAEAPHIRQSEVCATCHTLYTKARGPRGDVIGMLPEQVPYLEWQHSAFRAEQSCQSCHMPAVAQPTPIASVLGESREGLGRHMFLGGNFFVLRMLNRHRGDLGVEAPPPELAAAVDATVRQLQSNTAAVSITRAEVDGGALRIDVAVSNLAGHKLPTGYPARRAWLHLVVRDGTGAVVRESGAIARNGAIQGNDNDADPTRFEPHYAEIRRADQVQIYESVMRDLNGSVTTGLLSATGYLKDNRLLPRGFDKATAIPDIAVHGAAREDEDFGPGGDRVRYVVDVTAADGPFRIDVELRFQPIAFRWNENLRSYNSEETRRFVSFYDAMSDDTSVALSSATLRTEQD